MRNLHLLHIRLFFLCSFCLIALSVSAKTYYVASNGNDSWPGSSSQPWAGFDHAFSSLSGGDTLLIKDGTYNPQVTYGTSLPAGNSSHYTVVKAEHDFQALMSGGGLSSSTTLFQNARYYQFQGLKFDSPFEFGGDHIKIIKCAFFSASSCGGNVNLTGNTGGSYVLFEDCWAWGCGRYKFLLYEANNVILRRCVSRHDYHDPANWGTQCANFTMYDTKDYLIENCIGINSGQNPQNYGTLYGGVWSENNAGVVNNGRILGCVFLNLASAGINDPKNHGNVREIKDVVVWGCDGGYNGGVQSGSPSLTIEHFTANGSPWGDGYDGVGSGILLATPFGTNQVANSLVDSCVVGVYNYEAAGINLDYNDYFHNANDFAAGYGVNPPSPGLHDRYVDPKMKYICRVEDNSPLKGAASDGGDIGANVLHRYGVSGTLWGEPGYDSLTSEPLWPFPNQGQIKADMGSWTGQNDAKRGFCADGNGLYGGPITLTSYIWEYLGNPCPPEICGSVKTENASMLEGLSLKCSPNPFNPAAVIAFRIPYIEPVDKLGASHRTSENQYVHLSLYNAAGKCIATLVDGRQMPGRHTVIWNAAGRPSGIYLARLEVGREIRQMKLVLLR